MAGPPSVSGNRDVWLIHARPRQGDLSSPKPDRPCASRAARSDSMHPSLLESPTSFARYGRKMPCQRVNWTFRNSVFD
jgi:hypothetical protein